MRTLIAAIALCLLTSLASADVVLYDGQAGNRPGDADQGFYFISLLGGTETETGGVTTLTTDESTQNGYYNYVGADLGLQMTGFAISYPAKAPVNLDRTGDGYTVDFHARLDSETHAGNDRAGFSVIALSSDLMGIELGFWGDEVWAQSGADFLHAEGAAFDTSATVHYQLAILGSDYTLYADGSALLTGSLRDYSAHASEVYSQPDFLFFGDDTSSAGATVGLGGISVLDSAVPEPATLGLLLAGGTALLLKRRR